MYSWKDRIADWWNRVKVRLDLDSAETKHIALAIGISLILVGLMVGIPVGLANARLSNQLDMSNANLEALQDDIESDLAQMQANQDALNATLTMGLADQWAAISDYQSGMDDVRVLMKADILALYDNNFAYMAGNFSDYALHIKSAVGGQFTATAHLVYSQGVGNLTSYQEAQDFFFNAVNWSMADVPAYQCRVSVNGTAWSIREIMFNVGVFELLPSIELVMPINCAGLNSTWQPAFAYADIHQLP